jgi:hypothetical protein
MQVSQPDHRTLNSDVHDQGAQQDHHIRRSQEPQRRRLRHSHRSDRS